MISLNYDKLGKILLGIVKKFESNLLIFSIPYLHFVRGHPKYSFIYPEIFKKKEFQRRDDYSLKKKIFKNLSYLSQIISVKNFQTLTTKDALIINNIINKKDFHTKKNIYTNDLASILRKNNINSVSVFRNFTNLAYNNTSNKFVLPKLHFFKWEICTALKLIREKLKYNFFLNKKKLKLNKLEVFYLKRSLKFINLFGAMSTLRISTQIDYIIKKVKPKLIFIPIEGHVWEKQLIKSIKLKYKNIRIIGIQFSSITEKDNTIKISLGKIYEPDLLICNKYFNFFIVKKNKIFHNSKILYNNLLIEKQQIHKKKFKKLNCLITPELNFIEVQKFLSLVLKIHSQNKKIKFTIKLHPQTSKDEIKEIKKKLNSSIIISNKSLNQELKKNNILIYRGSTSCFEAANNGLWLLYYDTKNFDINPFKELKLKNNYFSNDLEFLKIIDNLKKKKKFKINQVFKTKKNQNFLNGNYK